MRYLIASFACVVSFVLLEGCIATDVDLEPQDQEAVELEVDLPPDEAQACPENRFVGLHGGTGCLGVPSAMTEKWASGPLFSPATFPNGVVPPMLAAYCLFTWDPLYVPPPDVASLTAAGYTNLGPDCLVAAPLSSTDTTPVTAAAWQDLRNAFKLQVQHPYLKVGSLPPEPVRVAMVDTSPSGPSGGEATEDLSGHGFGLARLIRELACRSGGNPGTCVANIANHLALPRTSATGLNLAKGGYFGSQAELAQAINEALNTWLLDPSAEEELIINLSVGWESRYGGLFTASPTELEGPASAVYSAITRAVCYGAPVIVAAGNDGGGPDSSGPMLPAAWETVPAPTLDECKTLFEGEPAWVAPPEPGTSYRPLVYAVGGVMGDDRALTNGRVGGRSRLAAPASFAVAASSDTSSVPTNVLTGTSVAAAVASGTAAIVWSYRPSLAAADVMQILYDSGANLSDYANFCAGQAICGASGGVKRPVHRVDALSAWALACADTLEPRCPSTPISVAPRPPYQDDELVTAAPHLDPFQGPPKLNQPELTKLPGLDLCDSPLIFSPTAEYPEQSCPQRQYYGAVAQPHVTPQPGSNGCPLCYLQLNPIIIRGYPQTGTLYINIASDATDLEFRSASLYIPDVGNISLSAVGPLTAGARVIVTGIALPYTFAGGASIQFSVYSLTTTTRLGSSASPLIATSAF